MCIRDRTNSDRPVRPDYTRQHTHTHTHTTISTIVSDHHSALFLFFFILSSERISLHDRKTRCDSTFCNFRVVRPWNRLPEAVVKVQNHKIRRFKSFLYVLVIATVTETLQGHFIYTTFFTIVYGSLTQHK